MHGTQRTLTMLGLLLALAALGACARLGGGEPREITMKTLLAEMTDPANVARWPEPEYKINQASSYDRRSVSPADQTDKGWYANGDQGHFIRDEDNGRGKEHVLLDADGPGTLVRTWFTCRDPKMDTLRIYFDGAKEPAIEGTFQDLVMVNGLAPIPLTISNGRSPAKNGHPGGINIHLPIPYAKHCKVTWSDGGKQSRYYNIEYRTYPAGTKVETWTPAVMSAHHEAVEAAAKVLATPPAGTPPPPAISQIPSGGKVTHNLPAGPQAIYELGLRVTPAGGQSMEQALRTTVLSMSFDGQETVWAPVGDFFGSGVGLNELHNWYRNVEKDGALSCRWVMPYKKTAQITILNLGKEPVAVSINGMTQKWDWDSRSLYFHACWRQERGIPTRPFKDWNYVSVQGKGIYMGDSLAVFDNVRNWWGEGDEKIYKDGEKFPSHFGTGSEDYYGYAWCSPVLFQGPFSSQVRCDGPGNMGHTTVSRVRGLDRIPFNKDFRFDIEIWNGNGNALEDYAATSYWYAAPGAQCNRTPQPEEVTAPISQVKAPAAPAAKP